MRLLNEQRKAVLKWIAEGRKTNEINKLAVEFDPPFSVSRQQVDWYRKTRAIQIQAIQSTEQQDALSEGLALKAERVKKLKQLAAAMEIDLFSGLLWVETEQGVGQGAAAKVITIEKFNRSEVDSYCAVLDQIAVEVGDRKSGPVFPSEIVVRFVKSDEQGSDG